MCPIPRGRGAGSGRLDVQSDAPPKIRSEPATERRSEVAEDSISAGRGGWPEPGMEATNQPKVRNGLDQALLGANARVLLRGATPFTCCDDWGRNWGRAEVVWQLLRWRSPGSGKSTTSPQSGHDGGDGGYARGRSMRQERTRNGGTLSLYEETNRHNESKQLSAPVDRI
jgi:hypothetical protein